MSAIRRADTRRASRAKWVIAGTILVALGVVAYLVFVRGDVGIPGLRKSEPPPGAAFKVLEIRASDAGDRPEAAQKANELSAGVVTAMNDMYTAAFLRPDTWPGKEGETPPADSVAQHFAQDARAAAVRDIGAIALAELGPRFKRVEPTKQELPRVSFLAEGDLSMPFAIVTVAFEAKGETKDKAEGPVVIAHNAAYWMVLQDGAYRILAYSVELKADTEVKTAAFGAIPTELAS